MPAQNKRKAAIPISTPNLVAIAFLNMRRHGMRAVVNVVGIAIAVAAVTFFLSFYRGTYEGVMFASVIDYATSHGQISARSFDDDDPDAWLDETNLFAEETAADATLFSAIKREENAWKPIAAPRLMSPAFAGDGSRKASIVLMGVDFEREREILSVDGRMKDGTFSDHGGVVIGGKLAETLGLSVGDEIRIQANTVDSSPNLDYWKISGIFSTGYPPMDRGMVLMGLADAQGFLAAEGRINKIYCRVTEGPSPIERETNVRALIENQEGLTARGLEFRPWQNYAKSIVADAKFDGGFFSIFIAILLFLSLSTMTGTMRVTVYERKREIGMLRATGWFQSEITRQFLLEALLIGIAGSAIGCVLGGAFATLLEAHPFVFSGSMKDFDIPNFKLTCDLKPRDIILSCTAGFLTALFAGIMPARSGARMPILTALSER